GLTESLGTGAAEAWMIFMTTVLKVQLAKDTGRKEGLPREKSFMECAQDMVDASARDEEERDEIEPGWSRVAYRRNEARRNKGRQDWGRGREGEFYKSNIHL
ncbi:hypothetical protein ACUWC2_28660, partial [Klebsiella pneumoniae]|uniref:hypothetical protein n=1 Tax=Klebsiella pneumoniae TaxID=573 RepID=UPI004055424A